MAATRTEHDSLGTVAVPATALYGAQTQRAVENFPISGQRMPARFIQALGYIKQGAAKANAYLGLVDGAAACAIMGAAARLVRGELLEEFPIDVYQTGSGTSTNMNANEVIARLASEELGGQPVHPNDQVNMCQSSNDVIPTAMHLAASLALRDDLLPALEQLRATLAEKQAAFDDVIKSARTHLMDATPIRLGQEFGGYASQVAHSMRRVHAALQELSEVALGGTATGSGINRHEEFPARVLAFVNEATGLTLHEAADHFEAQAAKDGAVMASGVLNTLAVSLMKIANDIRFLSSGPTSGLAEIKLPAVQPGSSIMPGKVNPVLCEAMMMVCARVMGNHTTMTISAQHGNLELNVMMPIMATCLLDSISILAGACRAFHDRCLVGIEADRSRCRELLELNPSIATALNAAIGYDAAAKVAKEAATRRVPVRTVVKEQNLLTDAALDAVLDVRDMTRPGFPGR